MFLFLIFFMFAVSVDWGTKEEAVPDLQKKTEVSLDISIETETNKYVTVKSSKPASQKYFNTFLAIRNKKTGKTRLVEANEVVLTAVVRNPETTNPLLLQQTPTEKTPEKRVEKSKHLIQSFGQSKGTKYVVTGSGTSLLISLCVATTFSRTT